MKKLKVLLGLVLLASIALSEPIWVRDGSGISGSFRDVQMLDDSTGWAVGDAGVIYKRSGKLYPTSTEQVWYSQTNKITSQTAYNFKSVCFADNQNGWIVGYRNADESTTRKNKYKGIILRTTDGGGSWNQDINPFATPGNKDSLTPFLKVKTTYYTGAYYGYVSCGNGYILILQPNGTWISKRPTTNNSDSLTIWYNSLWMDETNPNSLWVAGDQSCTFLQSGDGGASWSTIQNTGFNQSYNFPANTNLDYQTQVATLSMESNGGAMYAGMGEGLLGQYAGSWSLLPSLGRDNWNYGLATGPGSEIFTCGNTNEYIGAIRRMENDSIVSEKTTIRDLSLKSLVFPPNSEHGRAVGNAILHRYEPAEISDLNAYRDGDSLFVNWTTTKENNIRKWTIRYHGVISQDAGIATSDSLLPNGVGSTYSLGYHSWAVGSVAGDSIRDVYLTIQATCQDGTILKFGPIPATEGIYKKMPDPVVINSVVDVPNDEGNKLKINWSPAIVYGSIMRSLTPNGPWVGCGSVSSLCTTFVDVNVPLNDVPVYYLIQKFDLVSYSKPSNVVFGIAKDSITPDTLAAPTAYYNSKDSILTLKWNVSTATDLGGYWVCPEPVGVFASKPSSKYTVNHAAPIERTTWSHRVPDSLIGQTLQMHVTAMDRSGNIGPWSYYVQTNTKAFTNSNILMATAYNNGRHLLYDNNGKLHLTYVSADSVFYQNSKDDGYSWSGSWATGAGLYSGGTNPASVIGIYGNDTVITWKAETPLSGWVVKTAKRNIMSATKWTEPVTILETPGTYDHLSTITPPSMVVNVSGTHLVLERTNSSHSGVSYAWVWELLYGFRPVGSNEFNWTVLDSASGSGGIIENPACPTICIDSKYGIHVAWDYEGEIYWKVYDPNTGAWKNKINLSNSPDVISDEPSLSFYGDVHIVWQEGNDIFHNKGNWGLPTAKSKIIAYPFSWQGSENVNPNSSGTASLNPVFDGNYIAWNEATDEGLYKASYANYADFAWQIEPDYSKNPTQPSVYPQIAYRQNADGNKMTIIWTEGTGPLYSLIARDSAGQVTPQLSADLGGEAPSIYTMERDGYLVYTTAKSKAAVITVDFDSMALEYYLPTLGSEQKNTIKMSFYQQYTDKADYIYQIWVDNVCLGTAKVPSGKLVSFEKDLPKTVSQDGEGVLKVVNLKRGAIVTCNNWQLFAYDKATGRKNNNGGGAQSEMSEAKPADYRYELLQNAPNPCSKHTIINYQLAKQGQVSLKVYNTLGQVVKTLVNESKNPGSYSVKWKGNDEAGRQAAAGIYFYRIASGEFNSTKKMVVLR